MPVRRLYLPKMPSTQVSRSVILTHDAADTLSVLGVEGVEVGDIGRQWFIRYRAVQ